ncbi:MAG: HAMP domain-containing histidine kinase [Kouleothrix sp.]|nr:HAMP domain-containing histidine kinase [Kouleothrix sp.]
MLDLARVDDYASKIDDAATRMMDLLNDVLDLARLQGGQQLELERQPTDLVALARQVATGQQQTTDRHRILVQAPVAELVGLWDAARLERALANLVSNAIKYSPHGGEVCLAIEQERRDDGAWAVLHVQDYGIGIPEADLPHVFDRFHRGANVFGQISGTGLGLASARQIIEQHRGMIGVASAEGRGARFTLRLPLVTGEVADDSRSTPPIS